MHFIVGLYPIISVFCFILHWNVMSSKRKWNFPLINSHFEQKQQHCAYFSLTQFFFSIMLHLSSWKSYAAIILLCIICSFEGCHLFHSIAKAKVVEPINWNWISAMQWIDSLQSNKITKFGLFPIFYYFIFNALIKPYSFNFWCRNYAIKLSVISTWFFAL